MAVDSRGLANTVLDLAEEAGRPLSNMALQKVLYFVHGWHWADMGECLVSEPFEAWTHGPVLRSVYGQFKQHGDKPITGRAVWKDLDSDEEMVAKVDLPAHTRGFLTLVVDYYSRFTASQLRHMSHTPDGPWDRVWNAPEHTQPPGMVISDTLIQTHFALLRRASGSG